MANGYKPLKIVGMESGLVQEREDFLLPNDAYPILEDAFVWRERIRRKLGVELLGRLRRVLTAQAQAVTGANPYAIADILNGVRTAVLPETYAELQPGTVVLTVDIGVPANETILTDDGLGHWTAAGVYTIDPVLSTINYITGAISIVWVAAPPVALPVQANYRYYPSLPVMGLRTRELDATNVEQTVAFDMKYAYRYLVTGFEELPSVAATTWTGTNSDFFWTTNYWINATNKKLFWATNYSGIAGDPIRYYYEDGLLSTWTDFAPAIDGVIAPGTGRLQQALIILPFRGRLLALHTREGNTLAASTEYFQRVMTSGVKVDS
jgi:hypothetical protein